jgi:uncharacterized protein
MPPASRAVVVMGKIPRPGEVKTRLAPPSIAVDLYRAFLADVFDTVGAAGVFACAGGRLEEACAIAPSGWRVLLQRGDDLGERIEAARLDSGAERVVIVGSDSPMMPPVRIVEAFEALESHRAVFGPTIDGGYYLVGMTGGVGELLREVPWSTDQVMAVTRERARAAGIEIAELAEGYDLDEPQDLRRALEDPQLPPRSRHAIEAALATLDRAD